MNTVLLTTTAGAGGGLMSMLLIYAVIIGVMWFILIRPQKKQQKQVEEMQNSVKIGDTILLNSGLYGKVVDIINDTFIVEFGLNKSVRIPVVRSTVARVAEPNLTVGKKADLVDDDGTEYEYVEVEVEVDENGNEIGEVKK
ncbi:preprotein translocase subunit YajC [Cellulosilyticum sp. ST5]|uniref:Preprotein translocase, YajC subunit n=1 Tax=Cellulosilyticum lentocellum (strain ATCC 49066 / DSM 5427 / NCIMB 11756 / RHM5) TaxID=642492 RepID=F2JLS0_CELLD|nr:MULTISPECIES: preprotein translocase subunit YajC [Cellulosilyticum]ADZ84596.1 preprotein translocase, YajC subunit [Cellulosilyticum lentocellum DSM 5427]QEH70072.1 preprotein translocase subunit YajC [Cellulosilyticum sp. WCF-2]